MANKTKFQINLEYGAIRFFCGIANAIPYPVAMAAARGLGWLFVKVMRFKRKRTLERIRGVFPEKSEREVREIALGSLQNVLMNGVEMMRASSFDRKWMDRYVKDGQLYKDKLQALVDEGKGVVIMVPHSGNWYMAAWSMAKYGLPLFAIAARMQNPKVEAWIQKQYGDIEVLDRSCKDTLVKIKERLMSGRAFAILPDLRVKKRDVAAKFLGGEANVSRAGAMFAVKLGCPIVVAAMSRVDGKHNYTHLATLRPDPNAVDPKEEAERLTREALKLLDEEVRRRPHEWFWYNKRWILEPVTD